MDQVLPLREDPADLLGQSLHLLSRRKGGLERSLVRPAYSSACRCHGFVSPLLGFAYKRTSIRWIDTIL
jgi:hypothetical protein